MAVKEQYDLDTEQGHLTVHGLTDADLPEVCRFLRKHPEIRSLNLSAAFGNNITEKGCEILATELADHQSLVALHLGYNHIGNEGAKHLSKLKQLTLLDIKGTGINEIGITNLVSLANSARKKDDDNNNKLVFLDVSDNNLGTIGIAAITAHFNNLVILNAQNCGLTIHELQAIAELEKLVVLNVRGNDLSDEVVPIVKQMQKLCFLEISENNLSDDAKAELAETMEFRHVNDSNLQKNFMAATNERIKQFDEARNKPGLFAHKRSSSQAEQSKSESPAVTHRK